ncbi:DNA-binding winged helix-turn-helix (wHTH) protein/tetratricopeptide (TPR) repeat protein [Mesorhizobium soli]|uniref:tetratricopeptide repeat protein n=1 Tax=Pseudaminobacter soli (ex Li et al. 2025) TaxID=1295366 RepID=UPI002474A5DC|nr:tetratricopeptide repeat protein [Mesorhizobium soli]MDH6232162.1 DNA-binding winged helix-turn-helix (wHTH) protein/tetratricopeptide (TPR) repeat protein [Mesorhizobium soli]
MALRFAGFELDQQRAELRSPNGGAIRLRPKTFDLLQVLASHPGRVLSKNELMAMVWPNVHVGEDNLFQCIREIRTALGDDKRQLIRVVSGRGYVFEAERLDETDSATRKDVAARPPASTGVCPAPAPAPGSSPANNRLGIFVRRHIAAIAVTLVALAGIAIIAATFFSRTMPTPPLTVVAVMPIKSLGEDPLPAQMAATVTSQLVDGLTKIGTIRVMFPASPAQAADFVVSGELEKTPQAWNLQAHMSEAATGIVRWAVSRSIDLTETDVQLQQTRLTAGIGHELALRINALESAGTRAIDNFSLAANAQVAIEQATASINRTTPERFREAQVMLEKALATDPGNIDLQVELAAFRLRWIEIAGAPPDASDAVVVADASAALESALRAKPNFIPALEAYCRLLSTTNQFIESLLVCGKALSQDPWDGVALNLVGISQVHLGRFDDALATFTRADQFDTPRATGWRWTIGAGWTCLLMGRAEDALVWLQRSIAINPPSGRAHMLLAAAYQQLGRTDEARAAMTKGLELRPGATARNILPPIRSDNSDYLRASERLTMLMVAAGLPEN